MVGRLAVPYSRSHGAAGGGSFYDAGWFGCCVSQTPPTAAAKHGRVTPSSMDLLATTDFRYGDGGSSYGAANAKHERYGAGCGGMTDDTEGGSSFAGRRTDGCRFSLLARCTGANGAVRYSLAEAVPTGCRYTSATRCGLAVYFCFSTTGGAGFCASCVWGCGR